ncbi:MAG TPA: hypothetical protein VFW98_16960, partial [Gemmatimonadaceae bacterium]|nr:hypothetical protein [Gemmatimonadaceae bacterium]
MSEECLVYLIRDARARGDDRSMCALWNALVTRCAPHINSQLATLGHQSVEEGYHAVLRDIGMAILDLRTDRGDFLQVNFWTPLKRRTITEFNRQVSARRKAKALVSLSELVGEDGSHAERDDDGDGARVPRDEWHDQSVTPLEELELTEAGAEEAAMVERALAALRPIVREAFILKYREGWKTHSKDPNEMTISRALGKSDRQIRNYFAEAEEHFRAWREEA